MQTRPRAFALIAGFCSAAVVSGWVGRRYRGPTISSAPVVSFATIHGYHPLANLPPYLAGLLLAVGVPLGLSRLFPRRSSTPGAISPIPHPRIPLAVAGAIALAAFVVNNCIGDPAGGLGDLFHEGELLGFAPAFRSLAQPFEHTFLIHGFAMDVLPALIGRGIAGARVVRMIEQAGTWIAVLWLVAEAARSADRRSPGAPALAIASFCLLHAVTYDVAAPRSLVSFAQTAAMLHVLRRPERSVSRALAALTGFSLPFGLLYNYSEAGASFVAFAVATLVASTQGEAAARTWWRRAIPGSVLGAALLVAALGPGQVQAITDQIGYWVRYGAWIWFAPLGATPAVQQRFLWVMLAAHGWTLVHLWGTAREAGFRGIAARDGDLCVMLGLALGSLKGSLDRADGAHLALGGMIATALLLSLSIRTLVAGEGWSMRVRLAAALIGAYLVVQASPQLDPRRAVPLVAGLRRAAVADDRIVPEDVRAAIASVQKTVAEQRCFFTLDSSGLWYYLLDRPSCSRFHHIVYARSQEAQLEVVEALRRERPGIILFRDYDSPFVADGPANGEHLVYAFVLREYRPRSVVAGRWFWQRAAAPLRVGNRTVPGAVTMPSRPPPGSVRLTGWVEAPPGARWAYVMVGGEPVEIAPLRPLDGRRAAFDVFAPVAFLPHGERDLRIAVHDPRTDELLRVCVDC
jgi:hypothetical protein